MESEITTSTAQSMPKSSSVSGVAIVTIVHSVSSITTTGRYTSNNSTTTPTTMALTSAAAGSGGDHHHTHSSPSAKQHLVSSSLSIWLICAIYDNQDFFTLSFSRCTFKIITVSTAFKTDQSQGQGAVMKSSLSFLVVSSR